MKVLRKQRRDASPRRQKPKPPTIGGCFPRVTLSIVSLFRPSLRSKLFSRFKYLALTMKNIASCVENVSSEQFINFAAQQLQGIITAASICNTKLSVGGALNIHTYMNHFSFSL